jgi:BMFP domain-containing protein YqiC
MFRHIKDVAECTLKMQPEVLKKARTQRDAIEARYKKLAAKAKPTKKR